MGGMPILLLSALMGITATILMPARRTGTMGLHGSSAAGSSARAPGIAAAIMAIAADTMAGRFTDTAARDMATAIEVGFPMAVDTAAEPFEADSPGAAITGMPVAVITAMPAAASMVAAVGSTVVVDTGNSVPCGGNESGCRVSLLQPLLFWVALATSYPNLSLASFVAS